MKTRYLISPPDCNRATRSVRRLLIETGQRVLWRRRLRQTLVALLIAALVLTALPLAQRVIPPAQAQITVINRTCDPTHFLAPSQIIQGCKLGGFGPENMLEKTVINDLLKLHRLPASDSARLLGWERDEIRAGIYEKVISLIKKNPSERTNNEHTVVTSITHLVKARRVLAASKALDEFNRWRNNCPYTPPSPLNNYSEPPTCGGGLGGLLGGRTPPSFEQFQAYGAYLANGELYEPSKQEVMRNTARRWALLGGFVGVGVAAIVGAAIGATTAIGSAAAKAIFITVAGKALLAAKVGKTISVGLAGATAIAAPVAIIIFAVVVGVTQGIQVFEQEQIPGKLQDAKTQAENNTPNLNELVQTEEGIGEIFAEFLLTTFPDFPATTGVPELQSSDPKFEFRPSSAADFSATDAIQYKDWDGNRHILRMNGGWFVDRKGDEPERLTLDIEFINAQGQQRQAARSGGRFVISDVTDDNAAPEYTTELHYQNWNGQAYVARIPNITPVITALPVERRQEPPAPTTNPAVGLPTNFNVSHIANISDNDSIELLNVALTSPLTSNGVTLSEFRVDPDGKVFARIQPSCSATDAAFTLQVTDSGDVTTTETINVTVTRNQAPVLSYEPSYAMPERGSLIIRPTAGPSDDGTAWGFGYPGTWTLGEPVITPLDSSKPAFTGTVKHAVQDGNTIYFSPQGPLEVSNAGPIGAYRVRVPLTDSCGTTAYGEFLLNVTCAAPALTYSATNPTCNGASNGQITLNASGGTGALLYSVDAGRSYHSNNVFTGLAAGRYFVSVKDANACFAATQEVTLTDPPLVTFTTTHSNPTCNGVSNGQITFNANIGTGARLHSIDGGRNYSSNNVFLGLAAGKYYVSVKDVNACFAATQEVTLTDPAPITFTAAQINPTCNGASNGQITLNASGGTGPWLYSISGGRSYHSNNVFTGLAAGKYFVSVKDVYGCFAPTQEVTLTQPGAISASISGGSTIRPGQSSTVTVNLVGGTAPYTITLNNNGGTRTGPSPLSFTLGPLATTAYAIASATDASGCHAVLNGSATITVDSVPPTITCLANQSAVIAGTTGPVIYPTPAVSDNFPGATVNCTPASGATFALGVTTVNCTARDAVGNTAACSFTMTVRQPREAIRDFITRLRTLPVGTLTPAQAMQLLGHLERAVTSLERGQTAQACTHLQNFVTQVNTFVTGGQLTAAQGQLLLSYTNQMRNVIGCAGSPFPT